MMGRGQVGIGGDKALIEMMGLLVHCRILSMSLKLN